MKISIGSIILLAVPLLSVLDLAIACMNSGGSSPRRGKAISSDSHGGNGLETRHSSYVGRVRQLNRGGETYAVTPNLRAFKGEVLYGRLEVPWSGGDQSTLTIVASWRDKHYSTPLWMYLKRGNEIPSSSNFDKTSISYITRQYSRIRVDSPSAGLYHVMIEAVEDVRNLTVTVEVDVAEGQRPKPVFPRFSSVP